MNYREKIGTKEKPLRLKTPLMEALGLAEVTHEKKGNKMKAI